MTEEQQPSEPRQEPSEAVGIAMDPTSAPCKRCGTSDPPLDNGQCSNPKCRSLRAGHQLTRKYALEEQDVRVKTAKYVRDYGATTEDERDLCREYAEIVLTIRKMRKGTQERVRALAERKDLRAELEAIRSRRSSTTSRGDRVVIFRIPDNGRDSLPQTDPPMPSLEPLSSPASLPQPPAPEPSPEPRAPEPPPELYANGRRVTEADVEECLRNIGDEELEGYRLGRLSKAEAYAMAQRWLRRQQEFNPTW